MKERMIDRMRVIERERKRGERLCVCVCVGESESRRQELMEKEIRKFYPFMTFSILSLS